jgi:hypothetical protein
VELNFRALRADEIDVRIGTVSAKGATFLLYKNARVDMSILDETVGAMNWQRHHTRENANCIVSIWDSEKKEWISKEDTGTESNTEAEKGLASDSFKRACTNWGIGRELYESPFVFIKAETQKKQSGRGYELADPYQFQGIRVKEIEYKEVEKKRVVSKLIIVDKNGNTLYSFGAGTTSNKKPPANKRTSRDELVAYCKEHNIEMTMVASAFDLNRDATEEQFANALKELKNSEVR